MKLHALLLLALACAPAQPYRRGVPPSAPMAPVRGPLVGPIIQSGQSRPAAPRTPPRTWTPEELRRQEQPGVWAVTPPEPAQRISVMGVDAGFGAALVWPGAESVNTAIGCAKKVEDLLTNDVKREQRAKFASEAQRACLVHWLMLICIMAFDDAMEVSPPPWWDARLAADRERAFTQQKTRSCKAAGISDIHDIAILAGAKWAGAR